MGTTQFDQSDLPLNSYGTARGGIHPIIDTSDSKCQYFFSNFYENNFVCDASKVAILFYSANGIIPRGVINRIRLLIIPQLTTQN